MTISAGLGWSDIALTDGETLVNDDGSVRVLRLSDDGFMRLADPDEAVSRWSLRWMLWHHAREILGSYRDVMPEWVQWPVPRLVGVQSELMFDFARRSKFTATGKVAGSDWPKSQQGKPLHRSAAISEGLGLKIFAKTVKPKMVQSREFHHSGNTDLDYRYRVCTCHGSLGAAEIWRDKSSEGRALYHKVVKCGDYWRCPICSHRITMGRRDEIRQAYELVAGNGKGKAYMVTLTVPHQRFDRLDDLLRQMLYARRRLGESNFWHLLKRVPGVSPRTAHRLGHLYVGAIRTLEITWSPESGWHPHLHEAWIFSAPLNDRQEQSLQGVRAAWGDACEDWWLQRPDDKVGVNISPMYGSGEYLAKFGAEKVRQWGPEYELAAGHGKRSCGPWGLLERSMYGDRQARAAFHEYAAAMREVSPSSIHLGGRLAYALKQLGCQVHDDEYLSKQLRDDAELLMTLTKNEYKYISQSGCFSTVLRLAESGGAEVVREYLGRLMGLNSAKSQTQE